VVDVPAVQGEALRPVDVVAAVDLGPAGDAGFDLEAPGVLGRVVRDLRQHVRARPDQAHLPAQHVDQLRQLVQAGAAQEAAAAGDPGIVLHQAERVADAQLRAQRDRVVDHRAELEHPERHPAEPGAVLDEQDAAAVGDPDPGRDRQDHR
jgi:hypothetical protein